MSRSRCDLTEPTFDDPQPGDRWHELYSWWIIVRAREGDTLYVEESDKVFRAMTVKELRERFRYGSIPGYFVDYCDREGKTMPVDVMREAARVWEAQDLKDRTAVWEQRMTTRHEQVAQANEWLRQTESERPV